MLKSGGGSAIALTMMLAAGAGGTMLRAQAQEPVVGPPELRDFQLPGQRSTPPAETPPTRQTPPPAPKQATPPATQPKSVPPAAAMPRATEPAPAITLPDPGVPAEVVPLPPTNGADPAVPELDLGTGAALPPDLALPPEEGKTLPEELEEDYEPSETTMWVAIGLGVLTLLFAFLGFRRARRADEELGDHEDHSDLPDVAAAAAAAAASAAAADAGSAAGVEQPSLPLGMPGTLPSATSAPASLAAPVPEAAEARPWLELVFNPTRAAATQSHTEIAFEFALRNIGNVAAHNIRIDVRIFNASDEGQVAEFFANPDPNGVVAPQPVPPGIESHFRSRVEMPLEDVRAVMVEGRALFIPVIAFNVTYEWANGRMGQTSRSYLVGRETETPSEKMAPFRLDLGPRVYRSLGQRQNKLAHVA
jgi:hypothetical protein